MSKRPRMLSVPVNDDELAKLHALSEVTDRSMSQLVRGWINDAWEQRFNTSKRA